MRDTRVLLINDDGIDAPGLEVLERAARIHTEDVWVVAPAENQSSRGRALTQTRPVTVERRGERRFAVRGTPADCAVLGLNALIPDAAVDIVLSGVNDGLNLGEDVGLSGTIGACLQAAEQDLPTIAFSQQWSTPRAPRTDWACAERHAARLLPLLTRMAAAVDGVLNVNFPSGDGTISGVSAAVAGRRHGSPIVRRVSESSHEAIFDLEELRADSPRHPESDLAMVQRGFITVTPLRLNSTAAEHIPTLERLRDETPDPVA